MEYTIINVKGRKEGREEGREGGQPASLPSEVVRSGAVRPKSSFPSTLRPNSTPLMMFPH